MEHYLTTEERNDPIVKAILQNTFPNYKGRKISVVIADTFIPDQSWSGGTRTLWKIFRLDGKVYDPGRDYSSGPFNPIEAFKPHQIPDGCVVVQHTIFCGKDIGITILTKKVDLLPKKVVELSDNENIVLIATRELKSSYAGISNYRFYEAKKYHKISKEEWEEAVALLQEKKLLAKNKSITPEGRNVLSDNMGFISLWNYKRKEKV